MFLTQTGGILKPFAWIFGKIFNFLYELLELVGIENIAVAVILFTIVAKLLMMPLTIRQQKFSKLSSKMSPELNKIQEKYKGKKDEKSVRMQQMETQAVYEKYGTNPTAGCLPLLITLPIIYALYRVIYAIPAYVDDIYALYNTIAEAIKGTDGYFSSMSTFASEVGVSTAKFAEIADEIFTNDHLIDIMTKFGTEQWEKLSETFPAISGTIAENVAKITDIYSVGSFNILNTPMYYKFSFALLIPVLAVGTQLLQSRLSMAGNQRPKADQENPMAASMNSMMYIMPFMSGFFCLMFPICIGIYWVVNTVVTIIQQFFINRHIDKMDLDEMIQKNVEKQAKRRKKMGIEQGSKMAELAKVQTRSIDSTQSSRGTIASYANATNKSYTSGKTHTAEKKSGKDADKEKSGSEDEKNIEEKKPVQNSISGYANLLKKNSDKGEK